MAHADTFMKRTEFTLERKFDATPERMFRAWTDQEDLRRWIWASLSKDVWSEIDLRVGGARQIVTIFFYDRLDRFTVMRRQSLIVREAHICILKFDVRLAVSQP